MIKYFLQKNKKNIWKENISAGYRKKKRKEKQLKATVHARVFSPPNPIFHDLKLFFGTIYFLLLFFLQKMKNLVTLYFFFPKLFWRFLFFSQNRIFHNVKKFSGKVWFFFTLFLFFFFLQKKKKEKTSKPNERWCRILLGKKGHFPPPVTPFFFLGKKLFFGFSEKFSKFFFNEIDCKKFSNFFYNEVSSKKFFNSLKMTTKNFRNFFQ